MLLLIGHPAQCSDVGLDGVFTLLDLPEKLKRLFAPRCPRPTDLDVRE